MPQQSRVLPADEYVELLDFPADVGSMLPRRLDTEDALAVWDSLAYALDTYARQWAPARVVLAVSMPSRARCHDASVRTPDACCDVVGDADTGSLEGSS